ncbi:hypothetical protein IQ07DRAFT_658386 [Pyrenochaeta sp. DS3sAY3a]|nr:hypothetical protein IQ07DRAFT_658386 [Pyrenochaeta sp. DS3sAY3a]
MLFNTIVPALFFNVTVNLPILFGPTAPGSTLTYADLVTGTLISEPHFTPSIRATAIRGGDHITIDPPRTGADAAASGDVAAVLRLNLDTTVKVDGSEEYIRIQAKGVELATKAVMGVLTGVEGAGAVGYGEFAAGSTWTFETGSAKYWDLQNSVFVGSTSLRPGNKGTVIVGFKIEKVVGKKTGTSV